jgi:hypothetical protein
MEQAIALRLAFAIYHPVRVRKKAVVGAGVH